MAKKKNLYLVWQASGSYDTYFNKLCGVYDDIDKALELKDRLDLNIVSEENCWTIVPEDVYFNWPIYDESGFDSDGDFNEYEYVKEYMGYTREQRGLQEERWYLMSEEYYEAIIQNVILNEEL
jgi:hypothetical protein